MTLLEEVRHRPPRFTPSAARAIRIEAGVSQARLAEEIAVHPVTVTRWEAGTRTPSGPEGERYRRLLSDLRGAL